MKNLAITTPILGTIRLGDIATNAAGKRFPVRCNHFKITGQYKDKDGRWVEHPIHAKIAKKLDVEKDKLTEIPVRLMYNKPELNMRARYEAFDRTGRIVCAGDGENARRADGKTIAKVPCPGAEHCEFGIKAKCDMFARLNVQIEGQNDDFSAFILRTESVNSVKTLTAKMGRMHAMFGNRLTGIPFVLKLRQKASSMSCWSNFYYVDLMLPDGMSPKDALKLAKKHEEDQLEVGLDQAAYEKVVELGLANGAFEEGESEFDEIETFLLARHEALTDVPEGDAPTATPLPEADAAPTGLAGLRLMLEAATQEVASEEAVAA